MCRFNSDLSEAWRHDTKKVHTHKDSKQRKWDTLRQSESIRRSLCDSRDAIIVYATQRQSETLQARQSLRRSRIISSKRSGDNQMQFGPLRGHTQNNHCLSNLLSTLHCFPFTPTQWRVITSLRTPHYFFLASMCVFCSLCYWWEWVLCFLYLHLPVVRGIRGRFGQCFIRRQTN